MESSAPTQVRGLFGKWTRELSGLQGTGQGEVGSNNNSEADDNNNGVYNRLGENNNVDCYEPGEEKNKAYYVPVEYNNMVSSGFSVATECKDFNLSLIHI